MQRPLYAIGDVHGDAARLLKIMQMHGLVDVSDDTVKWTKPNVIVLLMGDVLDARSRHGEFGDMLFRDSLSDLWILEFMQVAAEKARAMGSTFLALIGNHELMNLRGDFSYASPHHVKNIASRRRYFAEGGGGREVIQNLFHTSVTYNRNHYSHAGIPMNTEQGHARLWGKRASAALLALASDRHLVDLVSHRDYAPVAEHGDATFKVAMMCRRHDLRSMVIGHNYTNGNGVYSSYGGRVVYTDTGISRAFTVNDSAKAIEIVYDPGDGELCVLKPDGSRAPINDVG